METQLPFLFYRREIKFRIEDPEVASRLQGRVSANLPGYAYQPGYPVTHVTTVYFDTRDLRFYRHARLRPQNNVKIRLKEYYYPRSEDGDEYLWSPHCWIEIKRRRREIIRKNRFCLSKPSVSAFLGGEDLLDEILALNPDVPADDLRKIYGKVRKVLEEYAVGARAVVNYRRRTYQRDERSLRVTFDDEIAFYRAPRELYNGCAALTRRALGEPKKVERYTIVEIKNAGGLPRWLELALRDLPKINYSKFLTSTREIYDPGSDARHRPRV